MDWSGLVVTIVGLFLSGCGVVLWSLHVKLQRQTEETAKELADYRLYVAQHYVTQNELTKAVNSLERSIERLIEAVDRNSRETREGISEIHRRIDGKADK